MCLGAANARKEGEMKERQPPGLIGFLLCLRPVCSAFLGFLGDLSRASGKPFLPGPSLCIQKRLRVRPHYKQNCFAFIFLHFGGPHKLDCEGEIKGIPQLRYSVGIMS
jgi:hypothetical protein